MSGTSGKSVLDAVASVGKKTTTPRKITATSPAQKIVAKAAEMQNKAINASTTVMPVKEKATTSQKPSAKPMLKTVAVAKTAPAKPAPTKSSAKDTETRKLVSEIIETAENAAQAAQKNAKITKPTVKTTAENMTETFISAIGKPDAVLGMSAFSYFMDTAENMQNKTAEIADSIKETHETNKANAALIKESACDTMQDISSAYFDTMQKSMSCSTMTELANINMEYASKIQHACNDMMSIMGKASYSTFRETMSLWTNNVRK